MLDRAKILELQADLKSEIASLTSEKENVPAIGKSKVELAFSVLKKLDMIADELYKVRASCPAHEQFRLQLEDFVSTVSQSVLFINQRVEQTNGYPEWIAKYRAIWRAEFPLFLFTVCLFLASCFIGWNVGVNRHDYVPLLLPQGAMENVLDQTAWFESIRENPLLHGLGIAWNNIRVAGLVFLLSALLGIGGLYILCLNGIFFGSLMGYCYSNDFHEPLTQFVLAHGPLELTIIVASAFAGLLYGRVFYMRPYSRFVERMRIATQQASVILVGVLPWLVLAACFEVFVSPFEFFSFEAKAISGLLMASLFWLWTFFPKLRPIVVETS